jgi:hypothetical protein
MNEKNPKNKIRKEKFLITLLPLAEICRLAICYFSLFSLQLGFIFCIFVKFLEKLNKIGVKINVS